MSAELQFHIEARAEDLVTEGLPRTEAMRQARMEFGGIEGVKEEGRKARGANYVEAFAQDLRFGARMLRKNPGFTLVGMLTLALGIGANTAIFSVVHAVLLSPLPFKDANRLVLLTEYNPGKVASAGVPYPDYLEWQRQNTVFEETAAYFDIEASNDMVLGTATAAERVEYSVVSSTFFSLLGERPALGRSFTEEDDRADGAKIFLASDALWRNSFAGDTKAIGKSYLLDGESYTLAGVMPRGFQFPRERDIWISVGSLSAREQQDRISHPYRVLGRLRAGQNLNSAQTQINGIAERLGKAYPATNAGWQVRAIPLLDEFVANVRPSLLVLLGAVFFIFLIACTNVVNLMLARASTREHEFAIRTAIGAARMRLVRQSVTESLLLVVLSLVAALLLAQWSIAGIVSMTAVQIPRMETFHWSLGVLGFTILMAAVTTIVVGALPALHVSIGDVQQSLREGQRSSSDTSRGQRLRNGLVITEVALAMLLLSGAGLMLRSYMRLNKVNPGFDPHSLITMKIALPGTQYTKAEQTSALLDDLLARLRAIPGIDAASATTTFPLRGESNWAMFQIPGRPIADSSQPPSAEIRGISADFFRTMGISLLRGREFREHDPADVAQAAIINEAMATEFFPGVNPIGQHVLLQGGRPRTLEIVGIVADVKSFGLDAQDPPEIYTPYHAWWYMNLVLRTAQPLASVVDQVRKQVAAIDKGVAIYKPADGENLLKRSVTAQRFNLALLGIFGALALLLAAVGVYGLLAFGVARRRNEISIRLALGAHPRSILRLVLSQGMRLVALGALIGLVGSVVLTRLMQSLLFKVEPTDPTTLVGASLLLLAVAMTACYVPARRGMRVDPIVALRHE